MDETLFLNLGNVFIFALVAIAFVVANVSIVSRLLRPSKKEAAKETTYECGEPPIGSSWVRFDMRFYSVALVFLVFDVEVALMYPWARVFRRLSAAGPFVYYEMFFFVVVLASAWLVQRLVRFTRTELTFLPELTYRRSLSVVALWGPP